jgi:hypothetical protein
MMIGYVHNLVGQYNWLNRGNISVAGSALTTDKSAATVHALTATTFIRIKVDDGTVALDLRWRGGSDGDSNVQNLYAMRGDGDHYTRIATLTFVTGTQTDGTYLFVDTITITNEKWADAIEVISDAANGIAHISLNTHGYKNFVLLGTTVASTLYVDTARE